jgi:hypothetical protein
MQLRRWREQRFAPDGKAAVAVRAAWEAQQRRKTTDRPTDELQVRGPVGLCGAAKKRLRIVTLGFGAGRQKLALGRWTNPKLPRRTCSPRYALQPRRGKSAGVAKRPRGRHPSPDTPTVTDSQPDVGMWGEQAELDAMLTQQAQLGDATLALLHDLHAARAGPHAR